MYFLILILQMENSLGEKHLALHNSSTTPQFWVLFFSQNKKWGSTQFRDSCPRLRQSSRTQPHGFSSECPSDTGRFNQNQHLLAKVCTVQEIKEYASGIKAVNKHKKKKNGVTLITMSDPVSPQLHQHLVLLLFFFFCSYSGRFVLRSHDDFNLCFNNSTEC